uniref:FAD-binding domain-containing protein n=1 Tax=Bionectria ochroleuca TaxID=29856 RepID=A0A8H7KBX7_BIOOC
MSHTINKQGEKLDVAIAGGGIAGLITAIALLKHPGVNVRIYERAREFKEIGASIGLGPNGLRSLEALGVANALTGDVCTRQKSEWPMIFRHWKTGEVLATDVHYTVKTKKHFTARYHRAHLHQALLENLPKGIIQLNKKTINVHADPDQGVTLFFEDGSSARADICVGADGIHSNVRKTFIPDHTLRWTGWVAMRATFEASRLGDLEFPEDAVHWIGHDRNFFHSHLGKGLFTTVGGFHVDPNDPNAHGRDANWDDLGSLEEFKEYYKDWNPTVRAFIEACPSIRLFPNYAGGPLKTWAFKNRVTLVGDAAHTHGGAFAAGGSLAINDAHALGLALNHVWPASSYNGEKPTAEQIASIFQVYENTRKPHVDKILGVVHKAIAGQRASVEKGKVETDEQLRQRVANRMNPWWISEHDVEEAFQKAINGGKGPETDRLRQRL